MTITPQRFVHAGFGNMIGANQIEAILIPSSACAKRLVKSAKEHQRYLDLTSGRTTKALILMEDGKLIGCALTPRTIASRIHMAEPEEINEGENGNEGVEPVSKTVDP